MRSRSQTSPPRRCWGRCCSHPRSSTRCASSCRRICRTTAPHCYRIRPRSGRPTSTGCIAAAPRKSRDGRLLRRCSRIRSRTVLARRVQAECGGVRCPWRQRGAPRALVWQGFFGGGSRNGTTQYASGLPANRRARGDVDGGPHTAASCPFVRAETKYAKSGDVHIAYQVVGDAGPDLVLVPGWVSHVEYAWEEPSYARFLTRLASFSRLITLDRRGTGLSDRVADLPSLEP